MDLLKKTETPFQEAVLLVFLGFSFWTGLGGLFYFFVERPSTFIYFGTWGYQTLGLFARYLGFAYFLIPVGIYQMGRLVLLKSGSISEFFHLKRRLLVRVASFSVMALATASVLHVLGLYFGWQNSEKIVHGQGGVIGQFLGGWLFRQWGFSGSMMTLVSITTLISIFSRDLSVAELLMSLEVMIKKSVLWLWNQARCGASFSYNFACHRVTSFCHRMGWETAKMRAERLRIEATVRAEGQLLRERAAAQLEMNQTAAAQLEMNQTAAAQLEMSMAQEQVASGSHMGIQASLFPQAVNQVAVGLSRAARGANSQKDAESLEPRGKARMKVVVNNLESSPLKKDKAEAEAVKEETAKGEKSESPSDVESSEKLQIEVELYKKSYPMPPKSLLKTSKKVAALSNSAKKEQADVVTKCLAGFGLEGKVVAVHNGVRLNMYEFEPAVGVKISKIQALNNDLALSLGASSLRILAPIPGKNTIGIEIPSKNPSSLALGDLIEATQKNKSAVLPFALGKDVYGEVLVEDLSKMPHLLVSGTTGSGKSVFTNCLISSLLFKMSPRDLRFIMVDPKMIELTPYNGIPHLLKPVISDVSEAKEALIWAEREMDQRYQIFSDVGARNIDSFNAKVKGLSNKSLSRKLGKDVNYRLEHMPYIVIIIDELADLMITQGKEVERPITRIAQKARACGIHLVLATQRPSAEIVTGLIKTNFPSRIAFKVSSSIDSRTILDTSGGERLLGGGDMLYLPNGKSLLRAQGAYVSEEEVNRLVKYISD